MKQDLDISNVEDKVTVVVVSNQSEFDQLMQHLEEEGKVWQGSGGEKPTKYNPDSNFPYGICIGQTISWDFLQLFDQDLLIPFPEYAAKHINPKAPKPKRFKAGDRAKLIEPDTHWDGKVGTILKEVSDKPGWFKFSIDGGSTFDVHENILQLATPKRDRIRIERKKYDELVAERDRLQADVTELKKDNDIWRKAGRETEQQKERALAIIELQGIEIEKSNNSWEIIISAYNSLSKELDEAKDERDRLKADMNQAHSINQDISDEYNKMLENKEAAVERCVKLHFENDKLTERIKAIENGQLETKLRDQRDMARFIAAMFGLAAVGFAVAVWIGRLVPVT